jgi:gas vesicle protein
MKSPVLTIISDLKEDSNKQLNDLKKSIQDLDENFSREREREREREERILQ